ncbi:membrane protein insertase YidC [Mechercharimyces sp. CAU 1602]|uniref:membrane protein insertase YidC n=1 Tax=Mechercharimyces sp. CAU 1602 TaxID=2973933 RepID=UPI0021626D13|nr:membrane protein insertase YidC [Mechercharimyces sp. CAU 1602]MCS1352695.1 membrane protein insertase YidC [Mechercharimyces sp. CAU 1602]
MLIVGVLMVTGCSPGTVSPIDADNSFWDKYFVAPLSDALDWFKEFLGNYGYSIIVLTIIIRFFLLPLTLKQMKSSKAMQKIQPEMQKLREKYKNDQQKMQQETMKLFQKHNVNPMAGCLPLLVQMPILIAFYQAIMRNEHIFEANFLWLELGSADPYYIFPLLAAVTTFLQSIVMGMGDNPQTRLFLWIMPIMIFVLAFNFPSALSVYWVISNLFTMVQYAILGDKFKAKKSEAPAK